MSSYKKLNKADVTTVSYAANKQWNLRYTSAPNDSYATYYIGKNEPFNIAGSKTNSQYQSLIYDQMNHMFYQAFTSSLNTGSIMFNVETYQSASQQRPTASYFNYNTNPLLIKNFPTGANETISVLSINQDIYGSKILPNTFNISSSIVIADDGNGNLYDVTGNALDYILANYIDINYFVRANSSILTQVGNIFYAHGLVIITNQISAYQTFLTGTSVIKFKNEHIVYENEVRCIVKESDFNLTYNPTILEYGGQYITPISGSNGYTLTGSLNYTIKDFAQGIKYSPTFDYTRATSSVSFSTISGSAGGGTRIIVDNGSNGLPSASLANSIGFNFGFYGPTYNSCNITSEGTIQFTTAINNSNNNIPDISLGPTIFPANILGNNENYTLPSYGVWTKLTGTAGSRIFTVEWKFDAGGFSDSNFQAKLYEGTNIIEFIYNYWPNGAFPPLIGIQNTYTQYDVYTNGLINQPPIPPSGTKIVYTPTSTTYTTGSLDFQPYMTTIGLYNDDNDLLMVAKLAQPIALSSDTDMTFIVKYDT